MPFQTAVTSRPAPAVLGNYASDGPRNFLTAGPNGLVAGLAGVTVGRACWLANNYQDWDSGPALASSSYSGIPFGPSTGSIAGIIPREQQALITVYLAESGLVVPSGFMVNVLTAGDIWLKNEGTTQCTPGMFAYANYSTGAFSFAAASAPTAGGSGTASSLAAASSQTFTGSISGNVLTVTAAPNTITIGATLSGGTGLITGTQIVSQLTGAAGGVGTYAVSYGEQSVASATLTMAYATLTVGGTVTGTFAVGQLLTGSSVNAGSYITALGTGTGGAGTYIASSSQTLSSQTIGTNTNIATKWFALSAGAAGELIRCSSQVLG
jgi:hypothetical protein